MRFSKLVIAAMLSVVVAGAALAHSKAHGIVKERMDLMGVLGDNMKIMGEMVRGLVGYDSVVFGAAATALSEHSGEALTVLFPTDSLDSPTEARPEIWVDWERFAGFSADLETRAMMVVNASGPELPLEAFNNMAQTCSACHEAYRIKK